VPPFIGGQVASLARIAACRVVTWAWFTVIVVLALRWRP
jgi:hypothetical protein